MVVKLIGPRRKRKVFRRIQGKLKLETEWDALVLIKNVSSSCLFQKKLTIPGDEKGNLISSRVSSALPVGPGCAPAEVVQIKFFFERAGLISPFFRADYNCMFMLSVFFTHNPEKKAVGIELFLQILEGIWFHGLRTFVGKVYSLCRMLVRWIL